MGALPNVSLAGDILDVERTIRLAIALVVPLAGIMSALGTLATRLGRLIDRGRTVRAGAAPLRGEERRLSRRARAAHRAILDCALAALLVCSPIVVGFDGPFFGPRTSHAPGALLAAALLAPMTALGFFLAEVRLSSRHLPGGDDE